MTTQTPPMDRTLDSFEVIEEEYDHLHPPKENETPVTENRLFTLDQVRDAASLARIFCEAMDQSDQSQNWKFSKAHSVALAVLSDAPKLKAAVKQLQASRERPASDAAAQEDPQAFAALLVGRFNTLIEGPLLGGPQLPDPAYADLHSDAGVTADDYTQERSGRANRLILQEAFSPAVRRLRDVRLAAVYDKIRQKGHTAICLSGGGIRSATFALGVLTGLAREGLLGKFDYLSTVSGGGYIGSWLSAWMKHEGATAVQDQLGSMTGEKLQPDPEPVRHLRAYSSYLSPKLGLLSADTWTLVATMVRNLLLNWIVVFPLLLSAVLVPRLAVTLLRFAADPERDGVFGVSDQSVIWALYASGFLMGMAAISHVHRNRPNQFQSPPPLAVRTQEAFIWRCLAPLVLCASALTLAWWMVEETSEALGEMPIQAVGGFALGGLIMHVAGWIAGVRRLQRRGGELLVIAVTGMIAGSLSGYLVHGVHWIAQRPWITTFLKMEAGLLTPRIYVVLAAPAFLGLILIGGQLTVGLTSQWTTDDEREWGARFNAWLLIVIVGWISFSVIVLILPPLFEKYWDFQGPGLVGVGGVSGLITLLLGSSAATPATGAAPKPGASPGLVGVAKKIGLAVAAPVFAVSLIAMLSIVDAQFVLPRACSITNVCSAPKDSTLAESLHPADYAHPGLVLGIMLLLSAAGLSLGLAIDTNQFSLHAMYRNRLVRAYLRASRPRDQRAADPFTGFDKGDDLPIGTLWPAVATSDERGRDRDERMPPLHVVNLTLNVVSRKTLEWQQRQAVSLAVSALHAGSAFVGYRRTSVPRNAGAAKPRLYGGPRFKEGSPPPDGISLGTAMTISGAAASPEAGYNSSPAITFLMALFNARLGWWLGNPGAAGDTTFDYPCPRVGVWPLIKEMLGLTNKDSEFVLLSDGGHFENLGLYEMVLRRCRFILVSDGGCDPTASFEDLGNALRKIRIDLGVSIDFPDGMKIFSRDEKPEVKKDGTYWAVGTIRYSQIDRPANKEKDDEKFDEEYDGILLYVKPALYDREPADVDNYAQMSPTFPHESTANQFFTESQFESYRALGKFIVEKMCTELKGDGQPGGKISRERPLGWPLRKPKASKAPA